jgi:hypothetical protein
VKMVHNGIEYGDMQLICEAYHLMKTALSLTNQEMSEVSITPFHRLSNIAFSIERELWQRSRHSGWLWAGRPRGRSLSTGEDKHFLFSKLSRPTLKPTLPPVQWVLGSLSAGLSGRCMKLTTQQKLVPRPRKPGSVYLFPLICLNGIVLS